MIMGDNYYSRLSFLYLQCRADFPRDLILEEISFIWVFCEHFVPCSPLFFPAPPRAFFFFANARILQ